MEKVSIFILNEVEGEQLTGSNETKGILVELKEKFPHAEIVLTLGREGAIYIGDGVEYYQPIFEAQAIDTTAAGDTFTGYFLAGLTSGMEIPEVMRMSAKASAITVTRSGAVPSIPFKEEVDRALSERISN